MKEEGITISGLTPNISIDEWKNILQNYGDIKFLYLSNDNQICYVIYENFLNHEKVINFLNGIEYPKNSGNLINLSKCDIEEIDLAFHLVNKLPEEVTLKSNESISNIFKYTKAQPPIFWKFNGK